MADQIWKKVFLICVIFLLAGCAAQPAPALPPTPGEQPIPTHLPTETALPAAAPIPLIITSDSAVVITAVPRPVTTLPAAPGEPQVITLEDNQKTFSLHVGERFLLKLGEIYNWEVTLSDPGVVSRVINIMVVRGAQGVYEAHKTGRAVPFKQAGLHDAFEIIQGQPDRGIKRSSRGSERIWDKTASRPRNKFSFGKINYTCPLFPSIFKSRHIF